MTWQNIIEFSNNIYWVGIRDWNRRLFDALIPLPKGTTYNSYLVMGDNKKALIDTVNPGFEKEWEEKIRKITDPADIEYVIMNHAEPDHAGCIPHILSINDKAILVTSVKGAEMAQIFFNVPKERIRTVHDGELIDLGGKTLRFIEAPMLHWPETMFTYVPEDKVLFPCDFFGLHVSEGVYDDEVEDLLIFAQKYFGEIMMPFRFNGQRAMEKIKNLEIRVIAPSHGPIHDKPGTIVDAYKKWVNGETKQKAVAVYVTMWNSTEKMIKVISETLASEGIEVVRHNMANADIADVARDLVDARAIVLGVPTVLGGAHPVGVHVANLVKVLKPPAKYAVVLSSYGWSAGALKNIQDMLGSTKMEIVEAMETKGPPTENDVARIIEIGKALAERIKEGK
jgi:flavorubredoxin